MSLLCLLGRHDWVRSQYHYRDVIRRCCRHCGRGQSNTKSESWYGELAWWCANWADTEQFYLPQDRRLMRMWLNFDEEDAQ